MRLSKSLALAVVMLVGFGAIFTVNEVQAQSIRSISFTSPDSGSTRGIDSSFVVRVAVRDFAPTDSLEVVMYLGTEAKKPLADGDRITVPADADSLDIRKAANAAVTTPQRDVFMARMKRSRKCGGSAGMDSVATSVGDADSVRVTHATQDTTVFVWYGKIDGSVGEAAKVKVSAFAIKGTDTSAIVTSTNWINVDGDRPANPAEFNNKAGTKVSNGGGTLGAADAVGEVNVYNINDSATNDRLVLNVGDTLTTRVKLGSAALNTVLGSDSLKVLLFVGGKKIQVQQTGTTTAPRSGDTLLHNLVLSAGQFTNLPTTTGNSDTLSYHIVEPSGNLSSTGADDATPTGVTAATALLFDTAVPVLDSAGADTLLPAASDTISDGQLSTLTLDDGQGNNPDDVITYKLSDALLSLRIIFDGAKDDTVTIANADTAYDHAALKAGQTVFLNIKALGDSSATRNVRLNTASNYTADRALLGASNSINAGGVMGKTSDSLSTGLYTLKFLPTDLAGNVGTEVTRSNVYIDFDNPTLKDRFPTKAAFGSATAARVDTLETTTAKVIFALSEPADSVYIEYKGLAGAAKDSIRKKMLSGDELSKTTEQVHTIALIDSSTYQLSIKTRDLAGNWSYAGPDTFYYASGFAVPSIISFSVTAAKSGLEPGDQNAAGATDVITLTAKASASRDAVTYDKVAILKVTGGTGVTVTGTGVTAHGEPNTWNLDADSWIVGSRSVTLKDTAAVETLAVSIIDSVTTLADSTHPTGKLDSNIVYKTEAYTKISVAAPTTATAGDIFAVAVTLQDKYGNAHVTTNTWVDVQANKLGVDTPRNAIYVGKGTGHFDAKAGGPVDGLRFRVRDQANSLHGLSDSTSVAAKAVAPRAAVAPPDTLIAADYLGALGTGDQGGFVVLTFPKSADHATLSAYRIYREVSVSHLADSTGALVAQANNDSVITTAFIPWGKVDAVPGVHEVIAVVATLDNEETLWSVSAESGKRTSGRTKQAFVRSAELGTPYELMAQTMVESRMAVDVGKTPLVAALTPQALSFIETGVAPRFRTVGEGTAEISAKVVTDVRIRAIDNIAPKAVPYLSAMDTPDDSGNSITVTWAKSVSDHMFNVSVNAVGGTSHSVAGVAGYNIYRRVNNGQADLIGQTGAGATQFVDNTVFSGIRYSYEVAPFDLDNEANISAQRTAMAFRNDARDAQGLPILGLFGADATVGFDDFFIFAENFGSKAGDAAYERAFDLHPNNRIDFNDFFVFADNFGKRAKVSGKVVPNLMAGINGEARIDLFKGAVLPRVGEELIVDVRLSDFAEAKGYGFTVNYEAGALEFVRAVTENNKLGEGDFAAPQVLSQTDGAVALGAFGRLISDDEIQLSLVFRARQEIEQSTIEVTGGAIRDGNYAVNQIATLGAVSVETRPEAFALLNAYPNPFNPETTIKYHLPENAQVVVEIRNMVGQVVRTLVDQHQAAGRYVLRWDAANDHGEALASGIYLYRIQAGGFHEVKKMLLLK